MLCLSFVDLLMNVSENKQNLVPTEHDIGSRVYMFWRLTCNDDLLIFSISYQLLTDTVPANCKRRLVIGTAHTPPGETRIHFPDGKEVKSLLPSYHIQDGHN